MKRDDVTGLDPMGNLGLIDKSSFLFDSLLLGPERQGGKNNVNYSGVGLSVPEPFHYPFIIPSRDVHCRSQSKLIHEES